MTGISFFARASMKSYKLIEATLRNPFEGIGKPEALKENLSSFHSRRIDNTHRLVYAVEERQIVVIACRHHY